MKFHVTSLLHVGKYGYSLWKILTPLKLKHPLLSAVFPITPEASTLAFLVGCFSSSPPPKPAARSSKCSRRLQLSALLSDSLASQKVSMVFLGLPSRFISFSPPACQTLLLTTADVWVGREIKDAQPPPFPRPIGHQSVLAGPHP